MAPIVHNGAGGAINGQYRMKHHKSQSAINFQSHIPVQLSSCSADHHNNQQQPSSSTSISTGLPRLSQALKSLRVSSFLSSSSNSTKSKAAFVDADDVIYYSNKDENNSSDCVQKKGSSESNGHARLVAAASLTNFRDSNEQDYQLPTKEIYREYDQVKEEELRALPPNDIYRHNKALAEIRQLYKSTPNFSLLEDQLYDESYEEPMFSVSRHSTGREVDCLGMSMSSTSTHHPSERPTMGTRASEQHFQQLHSKKSRLKRKVNCSNTSTATSSTTASSTAHSHQMEVNSPTDSGYLSRRQTPRHVVSIMSSSTKNLTTANDDTANQLLNEAITERAVDVMQESIILPRGLQKRPQSSKQTTHSTKFRKYCWTEHIQRSLFTSTKSPFDYNDVVKLIEQHLPYSTQNPADCSAIAMELTELMKGTLHKVCEEICRLSSHFLKCSSNDICTAVRLILPETMAYNCISAAIQAISLYGSIFFTPFSDGVKMAVCQQSVTSGTY